MRHWIPVLGGPSGRAPHRTKRTVYFVRLLTTAALALLLPSEPASASRRGNKLFLWKLTSPTTTAYLLGTPIAGVKDLYPLPKEIESAFESSKVLVVDSDPSDAKAVQQSMREHGLYPAGDGLSRHLPAETLKAVIDDLGHPADKIEPMKRARNEAMDRIAELAETDLDAALFEYLNFMVQQAVDVGWPLHPNTVAARNELLARKRERAGERPSAERIDR